MAWARRALPNALAAAAVGLLILVWFGHAFLNYDTFYALVWGDDLVHGRGPQYQVPFAPTPHPLATAVGAPASLFGHAGEGVMLGVLAVAAPAIWLVSDALVTGDALWSLHGTHDLAGQLKRPTGIENVPRLMPRRLGEIVRLPELIASVIGFVAALLWLRRRALVPAPVLVRNGVASAILGVVGLSLLGRYLFLAGAMLSLFAAVAVFGRTALGRDQPAWVPWRVVGLVVLAGILAFSPMQADRLSALRDDISKRERVQADLHELVRSQAGKYALRTCDTFPLFVPNHRPVPELAYWIGRRP